VYAGYTIFVAEVPSTLNEALFLDLMLERVEQPRERAVLLQHAIDSIASTFYTQVMFADFELQAHRLVEQDQPVTADALNGIYAQLLRDYYGDVIDEEEISRLTWARIPHFFSTPYYVYQYATCFASTASLMQLMRSRDAAVRADGVERYLSLLRAGGSDYPMKLLSRAGVDLSRPDTVRSVATELDMLVGRLEEARCMA
jgi:oligoendopeptidase F